VAGAAIVQPPRATHRAYFLCPFHHGGRPLWVVGCVRVSGQVRESGRGREREGEALQIRGRKTLFPCLYMFRRRKGCTVLSKLHRLFFFFL